MPRIDFKPTNRKETVGDFPRLKLAKNDRRRIVCLEEPHFEYVHTLRAPKIVNGRATYETTERRDGTTYEAMVMEFIGRPICLGDIGVLQDKGVDPKNCPICQESTVGDQVNPPERRFAMNVVEYSTAPGSFDVVDPYAVRVVVWAFSDTIFNKLIDFASEWGSLQEHDLQLGPCTNPTFQKYDISISREAQWLLGDDRKKSTALAYKTQKCLDLAALCGRKVTRAYLLEDLNKIRGRWDTVDGRSGTQDALSGPAGASLRDGIGDLLSGNPASAPSASQRPPSTGVDLDGLLGSIETPAPAQPASREPASDASVARMVPIEFDPGPNEPGVQSSEPAPVATSSNPEAITNFDDLLNELGGADQR
jgi:hypothetical protein